MSEKPERLFALDGWRAVSAIIVVLHHLQTFSSIRSNLSNLPIIDGGFGVELFFGISGFVICRGLLIEGKATGRISLLSFYIRRIFRILPPLIFYISTIVVLSLNNVVDRTSLGATEGIIFTCDLPGHMCGGYLGGHLWSLSVEEQFYLVIPLALAIFSARFKNILSIALISYPFVIILLRAGPLSAADAHTFREFSTICFGVLCALHEERLRKLLINAPQWSTVGALALAIFLWTLPNSHLVVIFKTVFVSPLIMYVLLTSSFQRRIAYRILCYRPLQILGAASYSFYLWQQLAVYPYPGAGIWFYIASISICIIFSIASARWLEKPFIKAGAALARHTKLRSPLTRVDKPA